MKLDFFSNTEKNEIVQYFGMAIEVMDIESFKKILREQRAKFHPDNFEKFGDDTIKLMATERFQTLEKIAQKVEKYFAQDFTSLPTPPKNVANHSEVLNNELARFSYRNMKIEIRTSHKDFKYHLFGTFYRWLVMGDKFKIPKTDAYLIADESHTGHKIGFKETIKIYLNFDEKDSPEEIVQWFYEKTYGNADALIIEGELVPINYEAILLAVKQRSFLRLVSAPDTRDDLGTEEQ